MKIIILFVIYFLIIPSSIFAQRYQQQINFYSAGDIEMSLGRYRIGNAIRIQAQISGGWAEDGGIYHIVSDWGYVPKVVFRSESSIISRLQFFGYIDPGSNGYAFLFAKWDNSSPGESHANDVKFTISSEGDFDINNTGSFSNASLLENILITQSTSGAVGIGNISTGYKLTVDGKILAEEVKVQTVPASDYVFEPDYNLRSLEEVDHFIQQNKHLPDIPSAKEFKENGVGLGEMDDMLLRKVEELTLYMIALQKKYEDLQEKYDTIVNQMENK